MSDTVDMEVSDQGDATERRKRIKGRVDAWEKGTPVKSIQELRTRYKEKYEAKPAEYGDEEWASLSEEANKLGISVEELLLQKKGSYMPQRYLKEVQRKRSGAASTSAELERLLLEPKEMPNKLMKRVDD